MAGQELAIKIQVQDAASGALRQVQQTVDGMSGSADRAAKSAGGLGSALATVGKVAAGFLAANVVSSGFSALTSGFSDSIQAATDLGESLNAVNVVFGESAQKILDWGDTNANAFGLSQRAFNQMATPLGASLANTGMAMDDVADNTIALTERAADMASVFNTDVEDALGAIQAALRGEIDPIERYGVSVKAAAVEARALADTGKESAEALTEQERAAARLAIIFEQTEAVAGDFANTSDSLANKQRIQAARTEELQAAIGEKLIPVQMKINELKLKAAEILVGVLIPALDKVSDLFGEVADAVSRAAGFIREHESVWIGLSAALAAGAAAIVVAVIPALIALVPVFGALAVSAGAAAIAVVTALAPFIAIAAAVGLLAFGIVELVKHWDDITAKFPILGEIVDAVKAKFEAFTGWITGTFIPNVQQIATTVTNAVQTAVSFVQEHWSTIQAIIQPVMDAVKLYLETTWDAIKIVFQTTWDAIKVIVETTLGVIQGIYETFMGIFTGDWERAWEGIKQIASSIWDGIKGLIDVAINAIKDLLGLALDTIRDVWDLAWNTVKDLAQAAWDGIKELISTAMEELKSNISAGIETIVTWFTELPGRVLEALANLPGLLLELGTAALTKLGEGVANAWETVKTWFMRLGGMIIGAIGDLSGLLWDVGVAVINGLKGGLEAAWGSVSGWLADRANDIKNAFTNPLGIFSPSKVFIGLGENIMEGLRVGAEGAYDQGVEPLWSKIADALKEPFVKALPMIRTAQQAISNDLIRWMGETKGRAQQGGNEIGMALVNGMIQGIRQMAPALQGTIKAVVDQAVQQAKAELGIASPSRVFEGVGKNMIQGMIDGLKRMAPQLVTSLRQMLDQLMSRLGIDLEQIRGSLQGIIPSAIRQQIELAPPPGVPRAAITTATPSSGGAFNVTVQNYGVQQGDRETERALRRVAFSLGV